MRFKFLGALLVAAFFSGCAVTASQLDVASQVRVQDLYFASTGVYVHSGIGLYLATLCKGLGAESTNINLTVPFSRRRADVVCVWDTRREVYEIKPISWTHKEDKAVGQLGVYLNSFRRLLDGMSTEAGRSITFEPGPHAVPAVYVPAFAGRGIEVLLYTRPTAPGVVFYKYQKKDDRKQTITEGELASLLHEIASSDLKWKYDKARAELIILVAQEHFDTGSDQEDTLVEVNGTEAGLARGELRSELMGKVLPDWFYSQPNLPIPLPGAGNNNSKSWDCNEEKCG